MERAKVGGNLNFLTGAGGFMQNLVLGYAGLRLAPSLVAGGDGVLMLRKPLLPPGATRMTVRGFHFRGSRLTLGFN